MVKRIVTGLIIFVSGFTGYFLSIRLTAQIYDIHADELLSRNDYQGATKKLVKAVQLDAFDYKRHIKLAGAYKHLSQSKSAPKQVKQLLNNAKKHYMEAMHLNCYDAYLFFNLALLEINLSNVNNQNDSAKIYSYFERAIQLDPNQTYHRYSYIRHLYQHNHIRAFLRQIITMVQIDPSVYNSMRNASFWSYLVQDATIQGLHNAIKLNNRILEAYRALANLYERDKQWERAVNIYAKMITLDPPTDNHKFRDYLGLGRLHLKLAHPRKAAQNFLTALDLNANRKKALEEIYRAYQREKRHSQYEWIHLNLKREYFEPYFIKLMYARSFFDSGNYKRAKQLLLETVRIKPNAQVYYYLARIAQTEKDWDMMEQASLQAMLLEPQNIRYIQMFYSVCWRVGKYNLLENELSMAIRRLEKPSAWFFESRAKVRSRLEKYQAAINDWNSAIRLNPKRAYYHAQLGEAYLKTRNRDKAIEHYLKAVKINPNHNGYRKRLTKIKLNTSAEI